MNQHLNIFNPYTKTNRENHQLENDLTRALAITLMENNLFLYQFIKHIVNHKEGVFEQIVNSNTFNSTEITIQKKVSTIKTDFENLFAVGISSVHIKTYNSFYESEYKRIYDPITDMFISIGSTAIILEIKPNMNARELKAYLTRFGTDSDINVGDLLTQAREKKKLRDKTLKSTRGTTESTSKSPSRSMR